MSHKNGEKKTLQYSKIMNNQRNEKSLMTRRIETINFVRPNTKRSEKINGNKKQANEKLP